MSENAYLMAWLLYGGGAVMVLFAVWWLMRRMPTMLVTPFLVVLVVLLMMPWSVFPESSSLAPAWVVSLFDGLVREGEDFRRAGMPLAASAGLALVIGLVLGWFRRARP